MNEINLATLDNQKTMASAINHLLTKNEYRSISLDLTSADYTLSRSLSEVDGIITHNGKNNNPISGMINLVGTDGKKYLDPETTDIVNMTSGMPYIFNTFNLLFSDANYMYFYVSTTAASVSPSTYMIMKIDKITKVYTTFVLEAGASVYKNAWTYDGSNIYYINNGNGTVTAVRLSTMTQIWRVSGYTNVSAITTNNTNDRVYIHYINGSTSTLAGLIKTNGSKTWYTPLATGFGIYIGGSYLSEDGYLQYLTFYSSSVILTKVTTTVNNSKSLSLTRSYSGGVDYVNFMQDGGYAMWAYENTVYIANLTTVAYDQMVDKTGSLSFSGYAITSFVPNAKNIRQILKIDDFNFLVLCINSYDKTLVVNMAFTNANYTSPIVNNENQTSKNNEHAISFEPYSNTTYKAYSPNTIFSLEVYENHITIISSVNISSGDPAKANMFAIINRPLDTTYANLGILTKKPTTPAPLNFKIWESISVDSIPNDGVLWFSGVAPFGVPEMKYDSYGDANFELIESSEHTMLLTHRKYHVTLSTVKSRVRILNTLWLPILWVNNVTVNNRVLDRSEWTFDASSNSVILNNSLPIGSELLIDYDLNLRNDSPKLFLNYTIPTSSSVPPVIEDIRMSYEI